MKDVSAPVRERTRSMRGRVGRTTLAALTVSGLAAAALTAPYASGASAAQRALDPKDPRLVVQTYDGSFYTVDPTKEDLCQHEAAGNSADQIYGNIATTPDGSVYGTIWDEDVTSSSVFSSEGNSELVRVGKYDPASKSWPDKPEKIGPAPSDYQAGLVAESDQYAVSASYHHRTLWRVNLATGEFTEMGWAPDESAGDMTWASNGDLLFSGRDGHVYRLPRADYLAAVKGTYLEYEKWVDLGGVKGATGWFSGSDNNIYGMATDAQGQLILANKGGGIARLQYPPATGQDAGLYPETIRELSGEKCGLPESDIIGMTGPNETLWAPAEEDAAVTVKGQVGTPITGAVSTAKLKGPFTVIAARSSLPDGVTLAADGTLGGAPTAGGTSTASFKICGADGCVWKEVTFDIPEGTAPATPPTGTGTAAPADPTMDVDANLNAPISGKLPASAGGGTTFEVTDPSALPPGVGVQDGKLTGVPTKEGAYQVPVKACTEAGCAEGVLKINVGPDESECDDKPEAGPAPAAAAPAPEATPGG